MEEKMEGSDRYDDLTRRSMLKRAGATASMLALPGIMAACGGDDDGKGGGGSGGESGESPELTKLLDNIKSKSVIVATYGGTTETARRLAFWDSFEQRTGVKIVTPDITGTLGDDQLNGEVKARWDSYHSASYQILVSLRIGKKPLVKVPITEDLVPKEVRPYSWQSILVGYASAALKGSFDTPASSPADFFDLKKFPGKRAWPTNYFVDTAKEFALLGDGVAPDELYPLDLERANAKINAIWDDLVFYEAYPQIATFLTSKTVAMAFGPTGIFYALPKKGYDVDIQWNQVITSWNPEAIIPDAPNMDAVLALSAWCTDPARQAKFCELTGYGPPSRAAFNKMPESVRSQLPSAPGREFVPIDDEWYSKHYGELYDDNQKLFKSH
jgi:putative spermidine/putrescine transport system substrate-binding protein